MGYEGKRVNPSQGPGTWEFSKTEYPGLWTGPEVALGVIVLLVIIGLLSLLILV
jgi:hypothetical protein